MPGIDFIIIPGLMIGLFVFTTVVVPDPTARSVMELYENTPQPDFYLQPDDEIAVTQHAASVDVK